MFAVTGAAIFRDKVATNTFKVSACAFRILMVNFGGATEPPTSYSSSKSNGAFFARRPRM